MNKAKRNILIILAGVLLITTVVALLLAPDKENNGGNDNGENNGGNITEPIKQSISLLEDESKWFQIANIINDYYSLLAQKNATGIYNLLEGKYISENNITLNNILDKINTNYEEVTYRAEKIYYNDDNKVNYYFVNGYVKNVTMLEGNVTYNKNINYLVIVKNKKYVIRPLENNINIEEFAKNYEKTDITINNNTSIKNTSISENNKLTLYINEFLNLLYLDVNKAYNMLSTEMQNEYKSINNFKNNRQKISNSIKARIKNYYKKEREECTEYLITDIANNEIEIYEYGIMDYKISY